MTARQEAFVRAYEYLRSVGAAHTQKDIAAKMEASVSNISSALNGVATVLTDKFLKRFNRAYGDIFNMDWLLYGEGEMLHSPATVQQHNVHGDNNAAHTITTYWMRHTWATIAAALDIPVDTISRALGHSQTTGARVTSVYIAFDRAKVDAANRRVLDWVLYGKR